MHRLTLLAATLVLVAACSTGQAASPDLSGPGSAQVGVGVADAGDAAPGVMSRCDVSSTVSAAAVKACMNQGSEPSVCLAHVFHPYLTDHTTVSALGFLQCLEDTDDQLRVGCHAVAHAIGRETFVAKGTVDAAFQACDQTCHSGCYHGVMERFLRGDTATNGHISYGEIQAKVATACSPTLDPRLRFQCLHGLGHAVTYYTEYDVKSALALCDSTGDVWSASSCWGGVFMENLTASSPELRDVSPSDYHYPCDKVGEQYKGSCYTMQTSRMAEMGLTPAQILIECRNAYAYELPCIQSLGRDLSNLARIGDGKTAAATCELGTREQIHACTRGVVYALADNTWDGRYALPFCKELVAGDSVAYCYITAVEYLEAVYARTADDLARECAQYAPGQSACIAALTP